MKKLLLAAICVIGFQSSSIAQESQSSSQSSNDTIPRFNFYAAFGASFSSFNLNDKLSMQGLPQIAETLPEASFGFNVRATKRFALDIEAGAAYSDEKNTDTRVRTATATVRLRPHYVMFDTKGFLGTAGLDISYSGTQADIFTRGNVIDLNELNPALHSGHISLRNEQLFVGPSLAFGFFQGKSFPLRLNLGYEWGITNGKWKSDVANVNNTVNESGQGRGYAKLTIGL